MNERSSGAGKLQERKSDDAIPLAEVLSERRRRFLTGGLGLFGAAALGELMGGRAGLAAVSPHHPPTATAGIFLFLVGGASQIELFDPKPELDRREGQPLPNSLRDGVRLGQTTYDAPIMGNPFPYRRYGECGMELSTLLPQLGRHADSLCLIRSLHHEAFDHAPGELVLSTGKDQPGRPSLGSWLTYGLGSPSSNLPGYVVLMNGRAPKSRRLVWGSGFLPAQHEAVLFRTQGSPILNLATPAEVPGRLHQQQLQAVVELNRLRGQVTGDRQAEAQIAAYELAFRMQTAAPELTDLRTEPDSILQAYGNSDLGRSLLLARRLVERGVRFVTVTHHVWDHHEAIRQSLPGDCRDLDQPVGALLDDLKRRGMLERTLVVGGTEFGRTAITQGKEFRTAGRDHHPHAFSVWLAGGGVRGGQVIGATDDFAWRVREDPVHIHDFHATVLHLFGIDHRRLTYRYQGLDMRLTDVAGNLVKGVLA